MTPFLALITPIGSGSPGGHPEHPIPPIPAHPGPIVPPGSAGAPPHPEHPIPPIASHPGPVVPPGKPTPPANVQLPINEPPKVDPPAGYGWVQGFIPGIGWIWVCVPMQPPQPPQDTGPHPAPVAGMPKTGGTK
jgi:hypothetical protein